MTRWYRAYAGTVKDDKLAEVAIMAGCSRSVVIATWHAILESAAEGGKGGQYNTTPRRIAALLCEPATAIEATFAAMSEIGMIGNGAICAWGKRQFESDTSTERSRKHREAKRNTYATLQQRDTTPPETEAEAEEKESSSFHSDDSGAVEIPKSKNATPAEPAEPPPKPSDPPEFDRFWSAYPNRDGANPKEPARKKFVALCRSGVDPSAIIAGAARYAEAEAKRGKVGSPYIAQAVTWLNQQRWGDETNASSAGTATSAPQASVFLHAGSPGWEAWKGHMLSAGQKPKAAMQMKAGFGNWFPDAMPPGHNAELQRGPPD